MKRYYVFPVKGHQHGRMVDVAYDAPVWHLAVKSELWGIEEWQARVREFAELNLMPVGRRYDSLPAPDGYHFRFVFPSERRATAYVRHFR